VPMTTSPRAVALAFLVAALALAGATSAAAAPLAETPFSPSSPFNLMVPANAPVAANGSSLAGRTLGVAYSEYTPAVYVSGPGDPAYTIRLRNSWGPNALDGRRVRISPSARRANDTDGHLTIVVPSEDLVVSLYQADQGPSGDTWWAAWGGMAPLSGSGANRGDSSGGRESGISQLAGLITPDDVRRGIAGGPDGDLGHALSLLHNQISNQTYVHPAIHAGGNSSSGLYMGQRVFLDPGVDVNAIPFEGGAKEQRFGRLVARTLQRYGAIVVTNSSATGFQLVNPLSWTSIGLPNPWPELIGADRSGYYNFTVRAIPSSRLRAMAPSGGSGVAPPGSALSPPPPPEGASAGASRTTVGRPARPAPWATVVRRRVVRSGARVRIVVTVRSRRAATIRAAAALQRPARKTAESTRRPGVVRARRAVRASRAASVVLRMRVPAGRARLRLVVTIRDRTGVGRTLRRETVAIPPARARR
jgi:hypothetical protein